MNLLYTFSTFNLSRHDEIVLHNFVCICTACSGGGGVAGVTKTGRGPSRALSLPYFSETEGDECSTA